jgi:hypothetical protein
MQSKEFYETWATLNKEQQALITRRDEMELELSEIRIKIQHLEKILENLAPLADMSMFVSEISQLGLTEAIRRILGTNANEKLSPTDVRQKLLDEGYDLSSLTAPMASIYKILSRLAENSKEVQREKDERGRVRYQWVSEDIPGMPPF